MSNKLRKINNTTASHPFLRDSVVRPFYRLRNLTSYEAGGTDILQYVQLSKPRQFIDPNVDIGYRARPKCGDTFVLDLPTTVNGLPSFIVSREQVGRFFFYRVWIIPQDQTGKYGQKMFINDVLTGEDYDNYVVDFTELAEYCDWRRVGWTGKGKFTQMLEYQFTEGLSYNEAIAYLYSKSPYYSNIKDARKPSNMRILGLNDRGSAVRNIQEKLRQLGHLGYPDINGVLDKTCQTMLKYVQHKYGLDDDGLVGPETRELLYTLTETR